VVELAAHELIAERQSAPQLQPGATPQEIGCPGSGSAESAIQSLQRNSPSDSRFQRWAYCFHDPGALPQASGDLPRLWRYAPNETKCADEIAALR